jgi:hypothetical protein
MTRFQALRNEAELMRRVAGTPAGRDPLLDRELLALADRLEQEADRLEDDLERESKLPTDS